jgi:hypothetical protein
MRARTTRPSAIKTQQTNKKTPKINIFYFVLIILTYPITAVAASAIS